MQMKTDQLWDKDAIFSELRIRAFHDGNGDGVGDFVGARQRLGYLQEFGVTCIWRYGGETILVINNLSCIRQTAELHLRQFCGIRPTDVLGNRSFSLIREHPYMFAMEPYSFLWLRLIGANTEERIRNHVESCNFDY